MGIPMNFGLCHGGPWNKRHLAHHLGSYAVEIDPVTRVGIPLGAAKAGSYPTGGKPQPGSKSGTYVWDGSAWQWQSDPPLPRPSS